MNKQKCELSGLYNQDPRGCGFKSLPFHFHVMTLNRAEDYITVIRKYTIIPFSNGFALHFDR